MGINRRQTKVLFEVRASLGAYSSKWTVKSLKVLREEGLIEDSVDKARVYITDKGRKFLEGRLVYRSI